MGTSDRVIGDGLEAVFAVSAADSKLLGPFDNISHTHRGHELIALVATVFHDLTVRIRKIF